MYRLNNYTLILILLTLSLSMKGQDTLFMHTQSDSLSIDTTQYNLVVLDTSIHRAIMIGYCTKEGLSTSSIFKYDYDKEYTQYQPNLDFLNTITESLLELRITIIFGSWCSDSQREVPRLIRILDELNYSSDSLCIIGVNRQKEAPNIDISRYMIEFVPTIIFYKNNFEIGRIVESPLETLEDDIASILMKEF